MSDQKVIAEVSTTLTIAQWIASFQTSAKTLLYAKQRADREFDRYFPKICRYITKIEAEIVREPERAGYKITVYVTCPLDVVQAFHKEAGVHVDIPLDQIRYRPIELSQVEREWLDSLKESRK